MVACISPCISHAAILAGPPPLQKWQQRRGVVGRLKRTAFLPSSTMNDHVDTRCRDSIGG